MEQLNFHKQKLYSLILAAIALISLLLPWVSIRLGGFGGGSVNGFRSWGLFSFLGIIGVTLSCFMGNKSLELDENFKKIAMASFGAIGLGALIFFIRLNSYGGGFGVVSAGVGLWICLIIGVIGLAWVAGVIKIKTPPPKN